MMRKFILKLSWFIFPILVVAYPLDLFISYNLKKSNDNAFEYEIWNDIYESKAKCDIAIYGSSRASCHFNSKILEDSLNKRVYNFGIVAQYFEIQYLRHLEFLKYNEKPKLIIVSLDIFGLTKRQDLFMPEQFLPYLLFNKNVEKYTPDYDKGFSPIDYYFPLVRYAGKTKSLNKTAQNILKSRKTIYRGKYNGYYGLPNEWNGENDRIFHKKIKYEVVLQQRSVDLFEQFIQECKNSGIDLALVYTPEYIETQQYETNRGEIMDIYRQLAVKYNLIFWDYSKDEMSFQKENFYDSNHLTGKGADIFTKKLAMDLKNY